MRAPWLSFILLAAVWGASFLFMRMGAPEFGPFALAFGRVAIAAVVMLLIVQWRGMGGQLRAHLKRTLFMGVINSAIPFALFSYAALIVSTGFNSILNATAALWTGLIAAWWFKERLSWLRWSGVVLGFLGVLLLFWDKASLAAGSSPLEFAAAGGAALLAAFFYGYAANWSKTSLAGVPAMVTTAGSQLGAAIVLAPFALWFMPTAMPGMLAWASVIALGLLCSALGYILYFALMAQWGPTRAATVTYLIPVFGIFWGWAILSEPITPLMMLAMAVTVLGTALATGLLGPARAKAPS